jgi:hypothetical protein
MVLGSTAFKPAILGFLLIASLVIGKYFQKPVIFILAVILTSILYQRDSNKENNKTANFEETLINVSKFVIVAGILGIIVVKLLGLFFPEFA